MILIRFRNTSGNFKDQEMQRELVPHILLSSFSELFLVISNFHEILLAMCFCRGTEVRLLAHALSLTVL